MAQSSSCEVWFYHLERSTLEQVLPELLERTLAKGWRAQIRSGDPGRLESLDAALWTYRDDSFLPHGLASAPFAERQPVLLARNDENANVNEAQALFVLDEDPGEIDGFSRCIVIFDGRDEDALASARSLWSRYRRAGHAVTYWRQGAARGWEKQT